MSKPVFPFDKKVYNLITAIEEPTLEKLQKNKDLIHELAEYCRNCPLYIDNKTKEKAFFEKNTMLSNPVKLYGYMIHKIVSAPVKIMADGVVILYMPRLDELLQPPQVQG